MEFLDWSGDGLSGDNGIFSLSLGQDVSFVSYLPKPIYRETKLKSVEWPKIMYVNSMFLF